MQEQHWWQLEALKHMVKRLSRGEQMDLVRQLKAQLKERPEDEKALTVVNHAQEKRMGQQREDPVEPCEENPEVEDTVGM